MPRSLDIVLPCFNPNATWPDELLNFNTCVNDTYKIHYILVNDGSHASNVGDQITYLKEKNISLNFISYEVNRGKGYALRKGMLLSQSDYILYTDIDFPFTNQSMLNVIDSLATKAYDIVVGYRNDAYYEKKMSLFRKILSKTFRFFVKKILKMPVTDTQCGLKGFNKKGKEKFLNTSIDRYLFDFEFIHAACKDKDLSILPVQVQLKENVVFSKMKMKIVFQELINLLRILLFRKN
jgi:glycosyltransferase involved in cell wall biosynthesis